jgi:hypothetical protein
MKMNELRFGRRRASILGVMDNRAAQGNQAAPRSNSFATTSKNFF